MKFFERLFGKGKQITYIDDRSFHATGNVEQSIITTGDKNIVIVKYTTYVNGKETTVSFHVPDPLPDIKTFFGREKEIEELYRMIHERRHKVIAITGQGGTGKSALATKLFEELAKRNESFDAISWRALRYKPTFDLTIDDLIITLSKKVTQEDIGKAEAEQKINLLIQLLAQKRCLVVLDNLETILTSGDEKVGNVKTQTMEGCLEH